MAQRRGGALMETIRMKSNPRVPAPDTQTAAVLLVRSHYRLADKPERTLEALRVFFPTDADVVLKRLRGTPVAARRGELAAIHAMAVAMRAQGFDVEVLVPAVNRGAEQVDARA